MSYSFSVRGATKAEAMEKVNAEMDKVVAGQPIHSADRFQAVEAAEKFVYAVLPNPSDKQEGLSRFFSDAPMKHVPNSYGTHQGRPIDVDFDSTPQLYLATFPNEYCGCGCLRGLVGMGKTQDQAVADLIEKDDQQADLYPSRHATKDTA